eukprot:GEMP01034410.1.p1 GENE.GEMP01034410.1~~GEMP01034410.1.p1  ORF type:complete len:536 (+),score=102.58 GEMP01034410.1:93-1700(+)
MEVYSDSREGHGRGRRYIAPIGQFSLSHDVGARSDRPGTYGYQRDGNVQQYNALEIGGEHRMDHADHVPKFAAPASGRSRDHDWYGTPVNRSEHVDDGMRATTDQLDLGGSNLDNAQATPDRRHQAGTEDQMVSNGGICEDGADSHDRAGDGRHLHDRARGEDTDEVAPKADPGSQRGSFYGRQYVGAKDHMISEGVAQGDQTHGRGRRYLLSADHMIDEGTAQVEKIPISGRRHAIPIDHLFTEVLAPMTSADKQAIVAPEEMRAAIREWLTHEHLNMKIVDEKKWNEVEILPKGTRWLCSSINHRAETISREGSTAQHIAEKLSQMPISVLRFFGVRFRRQDEPKSPPMSTRGLRNPSLVSPGVCDAFSQSPVGDESTTIPFNRESAEGRRYISSGYDHFNQMNLREATDYRTYGHPRTSTYVDGLDRGIGHGVRHIAKNSHFKDGVALGMSTPSEHNSEHDFQDRLARGTDRARETAGPADYLENQVSESGTSGIGRDVDDRQAKQQDRDTMQSRQYIGTGNHIRPASYLAW